MKILLLLLVCLGATPVFGQEHEPKVGYAFFYHDKFHGSKTISGELYDIDSLTASSSEYEIGTMVRVTRIEGSQRSVIVKINDRGPMREGQVINLSKKAAAELKMLNLGLAKVKVEPLVTVEWEQQDAAPMAMAPGTERAPVAAGMAAVPSAKPQKTFGIQVAAYNSQANADKFISNLDEQWKAMAKVAKVGEGEQTRYKVVIGPFTDKNLAYSTKESFKLENEGTDGFVVDMALLK